MNINNDLIRQCKRKNRSAQKALYLQLLPYLKTVCLRYLFKESDLQDVIQESFVLIFKKIDQFDARKGNFKSWAVRISINATYNYNKRVSVLNEEEFLLEHHDTGLEPEVYQNLSDEVLSNLLRKMPTIYYEVFNLAIIDCYEHQEISKLLGISQALSRKRLSRARTWLKNLVINQSLEDLNINYPKSS